jgi:hypothetical protein
VDQREIVGSPFLGPARFGLEKRDDQMIRDSLVVGDRTRGWPRDDTPNRPSGTVHVRRLLSRRTARTALRQSSVPDATPAPVAAHGERGEYALTTEPA